MTVRCEAQQVQHMQLCYGNGRDATITHILFWQPKDKLTLQDLTKYCNVLLPLMALKEPKCFKADLFFIGRYKIHTHTYPSNTHKDLPEERYSTVHLSQVSQQKQKSGNQPEQTLLYAVSSQGLFHGLVEWPWAISYVSFTNYNQCTI